MNKKLHLSIHTPSLTALRRKNALQGAHVGTLKLIPTAVSPHTKHGPKFLDTACNSMNRIMYTRISLI